MFSLSAQNDAERNAIKQFCGCFEVDFRYAETFSDQPGYKFHEPYHATALELVVLEEETPTKLVLQHVLVINDTFFIKHWRQDWEYQPSQYFTYLGNNIWQVGTYPAGATSGQWLQEVYEVNDSPRYSGAATWSFADGKKTWVNTTDAPLPRREYTKRSDYQIMRRTNRLSIHEWGWEHEQDNEKIIITPDGEQVLAEEKGRNTYRRVDNSYCDKAAEWWQTKRSFWKLVRQEWDAYLATPQTYTLHRKVEEKRLSQRLEELEKQSFDNEEATRAAIREVLETFRVTSVVNN
ncbi:MAG: hypothetical protein Kow0027_06010 [Saprospiraceae bacterium]